MRVLHLSKRMAATGIATALAAGALVASTSTTADAAVAGGATYTCQSSLLGALPIGVAVSSDTFPTSDLAAGAEMPSGSVPFTVTITLPAPVVGGLAVAAITGLSGTSPDFKMLMGATEVPIEGVAAPLTTLPSPPAATDLSSAGSTVGSFVAPAAGTHDILLPPVFNLNAAQQNGVALPALPCTINDPETAKVGTATVVKNASTTSAKPAAVPFHKGKAAKMTVKVSAPNHMPSGKVTIKQGSKTLGTGKLTGGKAVVNMGSKLAVGSHKVVISYPGDGYTKASKKTLTFKVAR